MPGFLLPALMTGLIIIATIDIYRSRDNEKRKRKRGIHDQGPFPSEEFTA